MRAVATAEQLNEQAWALRIKDRQRCRELAEEALVAAETEKNDLQIAFACRNLAFVLTFADRSPRTAALAERAIELFERLGESEGLVTALDSLASKQRRAHLAVQLFPARH